MSTETEREMRLRGLVAEAGKQSRFAADEPSREFFSDMREAMRQYPEVRETFGDLVTMHPNRSMTYLAEFSIRACTAIELRLDPEYKPTSFAPTLQKLRDPFFIGEFLTYSMYPISSNIASRGALLKFELAAHGLTEAVSILEDGCSGSHIGKKLCSELPYDEVEVYDRERVERQWQLTLNPAYSRLMNRLIAQDIDIRRVDGIDYVDPEHPQAVMFRQASSFYPSELYDEHRRDEYDYLEDYKDDRIRWQPGYMEDFTAADYKSKIDDQRGPTAVYIPFSLYELQDPQKERQTLHNAVEMVNQNNQDGGIVAVLDDVRKIDADFNITISKRRRRELELPTCSLWVYDSQQPELGFQEHMKMENGRGRRVTFEPALRRVLAERGIEAA